MLNVAYAKNKKIKISLFYQLAEINHQAVICNKRNSLTNKEGT